MSTLTPASASEPENGGGDAGLVRNLVQGDLGFVAAIGDAGDRFLFHDVFLVAKQCAAQIGREGRKHPRRHAMQHGDFHRAGLQHLGAQRRHFQHFLIGDLFQPPRLGHDARIGGIDAIHVRVDIAAFRLDPGRDRHRAKYPNRRGPGWKCGCPGPRPESPPPRRPRPRHAGRHFAAGTASMRAAPCTAEVWIGTCQPIQERALIPMALRVTARRPAVTCSPAATTTSYSRWSGIAWVMTLLPGSGLRRLIGPGHQLVGLARHGRHHHGDLVAALDFALDQRRPHGECAAGRPPKCRRISSRSSPFAPKPSLPCPPRQPESRRPT